MVSKGIRNQPLQPAPELFIGFIVVPRLPFGPGVYFFAFDQTVVNASTTIDESDFSHVAVVLFRGDSGHDVAVVYDTISLDLVLIPEITVADSW